MPAPENTVLGFHAMDFDATMVDLRARGVVFEEYDIPEIGLKTVDGVARDRGGAKVGVVQGQRGQHPRARHDVARREELGACGAEHDRLGGHPRHRHGAREALLRRDPRCRGDGHAGRGRLCRAPAADGRPTGRGRDGGECRPRDWAHAAERRRGDDLPQHDGRHRRHARSASGRGRQVLQEPRDMGPMVGIIAFILDSEGNRIGLQQPPAGK